MATDEVLLELMQELTEAWDPTVDTSEGSPFRTQVLDPFLNRIGADPIDVNFETLLIDRLQNEVENIDTSKYSGVRDLQVRGFIAMNEPLRREIKEVRIGQSFENVSEMRRAEVGALMANYFLDLEDGTKASGTVRMFFVAPQSVSVTPLVKFSTGNGLNFFPDGAQTITSNSMSFNQDGTLFFFDVTVEAENAGLEYNIDSDDIISVTGVSGVTRVTNRFDFTTGLDEETKEEGVSRAQDSITIRNLSTARGIRVVLSDAFAFLDTLQVIGFGDDEMQRDVVVGPTAVSEIPGGVVGEASPDTPAGSIHIGGKTDVYGYQPSLVEDTLDIQDITDTGLRVDSGTTGFTTAGPDTPIFQDLRAHFDLTGVAIDDVLRVGVETRNIIAVDIGGKEITVDADLPAGQFGLTYEIVRFSDSFIDVALYDLVAENADGSSVLDEDGNPVQPVPGDFEKTGLIDGSSVLVPKVDNVAEVNIKLPTLRVSSVEFLDPLTLEASGTFIPMADSLLLRVEDEFTVVVGPAFSEGLVRVFYRDALNAYVITGTSQLGFPSDPTLVLYDVKLRYAGAADATGFSATQIKLNADYTSFISRGDRLDVNGVLFTISAAPMWDGLDTVVTVREDASGVGAGETWFAEQGILQEDMEANVDADTGLFYWDVEVVSTVAGASGIREIGDELVDLGAFSEGWKLKALQTALTYSTKELPYLRLTEWVNDDIDLTLISTAYALRLNYDHADSLSGVQEFVDADDNRIVGEDLLIRHYLTAYVRGEFVVVDLDSVSAKKIVVSFINALDPTERLEISDLVNALYDAGATYVQLPVTLVALRQDVSRSWSVTISQDSLESNRVQHFLADEDFLEFS
jgi:hypothetical protein